MGVKEVRWDKGGTVRAGDYILYFYGKGHRNHQLGRGIFVRHRIVQNRQLRMTVHIRIAIIIVLEQETLPHQKIWLLRARCSHAKTFINTLGPLLMGRLNQIDHILVDRS
jgi:hypothetical protein